MRRRRHKPSRSNFWISKIPVVAGALALCLALLAASSGGAWLQKNGVVKGGVRIAEKLGLRDEKEEEDEVAPSDWQAPQFLKAARAYADFMITTGHDRNGPVSSPLFASQLDRTTGDIYLGPVPPLKGGVARDTDRVSRGSNPMHDIQLYRLLYTLSDELRDPRYAKAADASLSWFFNNTQSKETGLFAWGEHLGWDLLNDEPVRQIEPANDLMHEFYADWPFWSRSVKLAPGPSKRFALGLWEHQIHDKERGRFSRHARYDRHAPGLHAEYPRHAGYYVHSWAAVANAFPQDAELSSLADQAIGLMIDSFDRRRGKSGALGMSMNDRDGTSSMVAAEGMIEQAVAYHRAAALSEPKRAERLRAFARRNDEAVLKLPHRPGPSGRGFVLRADIRTGQPGDPRLTSEAYVQKRIAHGGRLEAPEQTAKRLFTSPWGDTTVGTSAHTALLLLDRYEQTQDNRLRDLALDAANAYLAADVPMKRKKIVTQPETYAEAIELMLRARELTGDRRYLDRAHLIGKAAAALFIDQTSPLPKASTHHDFYETLTGGDDLMLAFHRLGRALQRTPR